MIDVSWKKQEDWKDKYRRQIEILVASGLILAFCHSYLTEDYSIVTNTIYTTRQCLGFVLFCFVLRFYSDFLGLVLFTFYFILLSFVLFRYEFFSFLFYPFFFFASFDPVGLVFFVCLTLCLTFFVLFCCCFCCCFRFSVRLCFFNYTCKKEKRIFSVFNPKLQKFTSINNQWGGRLQKNAIWEN